MMVFFKQRLSLSAFFLAIVAVVVLVVLRRIVVVVPVSSDGRPAEPESNSCQFPFCGLSCTPEKHTCNVASPVVPNVVHFIWFHDKVALFRFHHYVAAISALHIHRPKEIWFWYNETYPDGVYWPLFLSNASSVDVPVRLKATSKPTIIFGKRIGAVEHSADVKRLEILLRHGGIYLDLDVVILKPLTPLMCYPVTLGQETPSKLNNGIILSVPNAEFLQVWYSAYRTYKPHSWDSHNVKMPYQLYKQYPSLVHVERECLNHPSWRDEERSLLFTDGFTFNWSQNYAVHTWYRWYNRELNVDAIKVVNISVARIFTYVLQVNANSHISP